jgi:hypothetical protein
MMLHTLRLPESVAIDMTDFAAATEKVANDRFRTLGEVTLSTAGDLSEAFSISSTNSLSDERQDEIKLYDESRVVDESQDETENNKVYEPLAPSQPRKSILKMTAEEIPICSRRSSWKILPQPDMASIRKSAAIVKESTKPVRNKSNVEFTQIRIREYEQTLGDNPSVSYGPPITLDWNFRELEPVSLEEYEIRRSSPTRRNVRQLCLNYYTRRNLLMWIYNFEESALKMATKEADRVKRGRAVTKCFLPISKVEDLVTSAGRKAKRAVRIKA